MPESTSAPAQVPAPVLAYIGLGANLGDPVAALRLAIQALSEKPGVRLFQQSSLYRSTPVDASGDDYVNAVVAAEVHLSAHALLEVLQAIEADAGRQRPYRNAPRTLDLDLLLYGDAVLQTPTLVVPHPRMWERAFVLHPLAEIAPSLVSTVQLAQVADQGVWRIAV